MYRQARERIIAAEVRKLERRQRWSDARGTAAHRQDAARVRGARLSAPRPPR
jgi:hypothetical protein